MSNGAGSTFVRPKISDFKKEIAERVVLHCDLNNFYASVECKDRPELKKVPMAVCGSIDDRAGIVLAKNEIAKSFGVKTAETIWQAKQKCRNLVVVSPSFAKYERYSKMAYEIYLRFTDMVEAFGIDECWLDVTGSQRLFGNGEEIAEQIRTTIKNELGLTVSIGVSFNKVFAKLGSDLKKPDAITVISKNSFQEKLWKLPASDMLWVGPATKKHLERFHITTIGDVARSDPDFLQRTLGVSGIQLWRNANGLDNDPVRTVAYTREIKSIGNSTTCRSDLENPRQVWQVMLRLAEQVTMRMRDEHLTAKGVQISVKTSDLVTHEFQTQLDTPVRTSLQLCEKGFELFKQRFSWEKNVRAVGIRGFNLVPDTTECQISMLSNPEKIEKLEKLADVTDKLKKRYGNDIVYPAILGDELYSTLSTHSEHKLCGD